MGQTLVALGWTWHVFLALSQLQCRCPIVRCYREVKYEKDLSTLVQSFDVQQFPEIGWLLVSCMVRLITCISPTTPILGRMTARLSFACVVKRGEYLIAGITLNC